MADEVQEGILGSRSSGDHRRGSQVGRSSSGPKGIFSSKRTYVLGRDQSQSPADESKGVWLALGAGEAR